MAGTPGVVTRLLSDLKNMQGSIRFQHDFVGLQILPPDSQGPDARERRERTLQPTALVHEAYLRRVDQHAMNWQSRAHSFALAARLTRRILVDYERRQTDVEETGRFHWRMPQSISLQISEELLSPDEALTKLAEMTRRQSRIVELRYFGGLTVEETVSVLDIAPKNSQA